jgi:hypothetical protein
MAGKTHFAGSLDREACLISVLPQLVDLTKASDGRSAAVCCPTFTIPWADVVRSKRLLTRPR